MVANQFSLKIKMIRTHNASDFLKSECGALFSSLGIAQQNGVVERKQFHILELARSLHFQSSILLKYRDNYVLTALHLIKRTPTPLLDNKFPFEDLFHRLYFYDHLRVFGCLYHAMSLHVEHECSLKAQARVFLGFQTFKRGTRL